MSGTFNEGALPGYMRDETEGEHGFQWRHVDLLRHQAGQEAVEFGGEGDFRMRRLRQQRERMFDEIANLIQRFLPDRGAAGESGTATPGGVLAHAARPPAVSPDCCSACNRPAVMRVGTMPFCGHHAPAFPPLGPRA